MKIVDSIQDRGINQVNGRNAISVVYLFVSPLLIFWHHDHSFNKLRHLNCTLSQHFDALFRSM
jgi:hypothetical protein